MASSLRRVVVVVVVLLPALILPVCSSGTSAWRSSGGCEHITVSHGYTDVEAKAIAAQVATWNASHPNIQVRLLFNGGNDSALQKTLANIAVGSPPDIAYEYGSSMAALAV